LQFRMGQTHVQQHMPELLEHIGNGRLQPEIIVSHQLKLADAALGYEMFDKKLEECRKVVLTP
ncbi:MAG: glutathione-dependent formaldehyde dehydrogenase, partial [Casimicrobiaceae bacterium]